MEETVATIEPTTPDPTTEDEEKEAPDRKAIVFTAPLALYELISRKAEEEELSVPAWVRQFVAEEFDYDLPAIQIRRKYATPEEAAAARKETAAKRNKLQSLLFKALSEGRINLAALGLSPDDL